MIRYDMIRLYEMRCDNINELSNHLFRTILNNIYERIIERTIPYYIGANELDNELWVSELKYPREDKKTYQTIAMWAKCRTFAVQIKRNIN